jgi:hypothetical protein
MIARKIKNIMYKEKKSMKKFISAILVLMLVFTSLFVISTSAAEADDIVHSLLPAADDTNGKVTLNNCEYTCNADGSVTFTVTGAGASVNVVYAEGATVWAGDAFNAKEGAYFVVDYGSADGATLGQSTQAHYTRKDKDAAGTVADLWLTSMESSDYAQYQKAKGDGYVIWDIGTYISSSDSKVFEDGMHRFTSLELYIEGAVGSSVTVYRFYVGTADAVEGIGSVRPEAKVPEVSEPDESEPAVDIEIPEGAVNLGRAPVNTSIAAGSTTVVSDPAIIHNYNVKWTSCALLRPTENENEYSVVAVQWLNGDDSFLFADAQEGDIVLSVHGDETVEGSQANRDALDTLVAGDIVTLIGYDFEKLTAADDAVVFFVPNTAEQPDDSSEPADESEEPSEEPSKDESKEDTSVPATNDSEAPSDDEGGNTGLIIGIVAGVVAVAVIVVVVIVVVKKKK